MELDGMWIKQSEEYYGYSSSLMNIIRFIYIITAPHCLFVQVAFFIQVGMLENDLGVFKRFHPPFD